MIYLDSNATERLRPEARAAAIAAMELAGNPSSVHAAGRQARRMLEDARQTVASHVGAAPAEIVFCSGGTEANALAIAGLSAGRRVIVGATEHDSVRLAVSGAVVLPVLRTGQVDLPALQSLLRQGPALVCLMLANNETGVLHPVAEAAALCRAHGALLHVDAVQAAGRIAFTLRQLGADSLAISGHKLGGLKGAGVLVLAPGLALAPQMAGGGQERGRRGGTPALPAIAGLAAAFDAAMADPSRVAQLAAWRDHIEARADAIVCGSGQRLPNTTCLARPGLRSDMQVIALDLAGIAVSAGAACSSGKVARSHVLDAMGLGELADCAIRVSLGWATTGDDVERFLTAYARQPVSA